MANFTLISGVLFIIMVAILIILTCMVIYKKFF
ncbi:cell division protein FtsL [Alkalibacillus filiformis]|uniref:Cell division protein FtsL n=1 Tax=Alkalibacillus filiformis TaxID=200990 RepID=A0ABU0DXA0_9BACI|nr:cell division protein FtsL [Alkalibacillus filiformis]